MKATRVALPVLIATMAVLAVACIEPAPPATTTTTTTTTTTLPDDPNGRYVATTGEDTGDCKASATPCATVQYAVSQATAGETVYVAAGVYPELVQVGTPITIKGANAGIAGDGVRGAESTIKGIRNPGNPGTTQIDLTVDGLRIDPQGDTALISATLQPLVWLRGGNVSITNSVFNGGDYASACSFNCTTMTDAAFTVQSGTVDFSDNKVENFRRPINITQPLGAPATSATVADNVFTGVTSRAISLAGATGVQMLGQTVTGNSIDATGRTGSSSPAGITISNQGNLIQGNTFTGLASGVYVDICKKFITNGNQILDNSFVGNGGGVNISVNTDGGQCVSSNVEGSGGWVVGAGKLDGMLINGNSFTGNTSYALRYAGYNWGFFNAANPTLLSGPIDATCNWFNSASGPSATVQIDYPNTTLTPIADQVVNSGAPAPGTFTTAPYLTAEDGACDGGI